MQNLEIRQEASLRLTPLLEQSFHILQMDQASLMRYLEEAAMENPLMDPDLTFSQPETVPVERYRSRRGKEIDEGNDTWRIEDLPDPRTQDGLMSYLMFQINSAFSGKDKELIVYLLGFVEESGYLNPSFETICRESAYSAGELRRALERLQSLDPPGVGASNLAECLLLQLEQGYDIERKLVSGYLNELAYGNHKNLARELGVTMGRLKEAINRIKALDPRPGMAYSEDFQPQFIVPDIYVTCEADGRLEVSVTGSRQAVRLCESYAALLRHTEDAELKKYLGKKREELFYLQNCLDKREKTLLKLGEAIAVYQERFFRYGPSALSSFCMKDAAQLMGVHKSTVSRAVKGKFLSCVFGTFPIKYFFIRSLHCEQPGISPIDAKREISKLIQGENRAFPMSDEELARILSKRGIAISRRTVAKYRSSLGIPNSSERAVKTFSRS